MEKNKVKKIVFLTSTRADFGKIKPLISVLLKDNAFDVHIFATGMHMNAKYGGTVNEIEKFGAPNIYKFINHSDSSGLDTIFANTVSGLGNYVRELKPDMIIIHGDRTEALAGSIVGSLNNIIVAHIEGGELSGTIDGVLRHAISKISHIHFVANNEAKKRLIQMGEKRESIFVIGSPDLDSMDSKNLPVIDYVKKYYNIPFEEYAIFIFHPVTTELQNILEYTNIVIDSLIDSKFNFVVIYPNNDPGTDVILSLFKNKLINNKNFAVFPSIRFEYFLTLLKNANFIIGNSSAGVREAPYYGIPAINIGSRQNDRVKLGKLNNVFNCRHNKKEILKLIGRFSKKKVSYKPKFHFGNGKSAENFLRIIHQKEVWKTNIQKKFRDIDF